MVRERGESSDGDMRFSIRHLAVCAALAAFLPGAAVADDWLASKVRGPVMQYTEGEWIPLKRGDIVPDDRLVRTLKGGRITLQRGNETIALESQTQIRILDKPGRVFTTVRQDFGEVSIEADVRKVEHFSVKTPLIAAVVKGTKFTVRSGEHDAEVSVRRGHVAVTDADTGQTVLLAAGDSASTEDGGIPLSVESRGKSPVVFGADGKPVSVPGRGKGSENGNGPTKSGEKSEASSSNGGGNSSNSNAGGNGNGNAGGNSENSNAGGNGNGNGRN